MKSNYDYDTIRDYLHGLVDPDTARNLRDLIGNDEVTRNIAIGILQLEYEFNGDEHEIEAYFEQLRQRQLKLIGEQKQKRFTSSWIKLAAAILLFAVTASVIWLTVLRKDFHDLADQELSQPYALSLLDRGASNESAADVAFGYYVKHDYQNAISSFNHVESADRDVSVIFFDGLSNLYAGDYARAIILLESPQLQTSRYNEQALWFQSLALIKNGRNEEAKIILRRIGNDNSNYKSEMANQLLKLLK